MFHVLCHSLKALGYPIKTMMQVRKLLSGSLNYDNQANFCKKMWTEQGLVCPTDLHQLQTLIETRGASFQGNDTCLSWLLQHHPWFEKLGFIIFSSWGFHHTQVLSTSSSQAYLLLLNRADINHWQLASMNHWVAISKPLVPLILGAEEQKE